MNTNYSDRETFLRTASGFEKDALSAFERIDDLTGQEVIDREDDLRNGAAICAKINTGWAGMTEDELLAQYNAEIDRALEHARDEVAELAKDDEQQ